MRQGFSLTLKFADFWLSQAIQLDLGAPACFLCADFYVGLGGLNSGPLTSVPSALVAAPSPQLYSWLPFVTKHAMTVPAHVFVSELSYLYRFLYPLPSPPLGLCSDVAIPLRTRDALL